MTDEEYAALGLLPPTARLAPPFGPADVASILDRAASECHDAEALVDATRRMTFGEVARSVEAAASRLDRAGIRAGDRVAGSFANGNGLVIAFFATMRLGAVWVGINKVLPASDKRYILDHSGAKLLLADTSLADQVADLRAGLPPLSDVWFVDDPERDGGWSAAMAGGDGTAAPRVAVDPFAPAAIMYTSGTTGVPKGVVHSQHNMVTVPAATLGNGLQSPKARRGGVLPLTITNAMILGPVAAFWDLRPFIFGPSSKPAPLVAWLHKERIEQVAIVPTMVYDLLEADLDLPTGLRLGCGGAPLPQLIRERFRKRYGYDIRNTYGLTEAPTVLALSRDLDTPEGASGIPLPHIDLTIRDGDGKPVANGTVGEICVGPVKSGPWADVYTPALGYWQEPEKTAALLRDGVLHTGDHGRLDEEGWLFIADRSSELILRGGSNVYPAEVERVLGLHPAVADCAVVGKPDLRMGMLTVACILRASPGTDEQALVEELRQLCAENLSRYKVPDLWHFVDSFPRNAMGKIVKPKLREIVAGQSEPE